MRVIKLVGKHSDKSVIPSQSVVLTKNSSIKDIKNFIQEHNRSVYICTGMLTKEAISVIDELAKHYSADNILSGNIRLVGIEQNKVIEYLRATIDISNMD